VESDSGGVVAVSETQWKTLNLVVALAATSAAIASVLVGFCGVLPLEYSSWKPALWIAAAVFGIPAILSTLAFFGVGAWAWVGKLHRRSVARPQLPAAFSEIADTPVTVIDVLACSDGKEPAFVFAESLIRGVLGKAQLAMSPICAHALCSFKHVVSDEEGNEWVQCVFPPNLTAKFREFSNKVRRVEKKQSYVQQILNDGDQSPDYIVLPNLWGEGVSRPFGRDYERQLKDSGVNGVALTQVCLFDSKRNRLVPKAAFKVFIFKEGELKDGKDLRDFMKFYSGMCALMLHVTFRIFDVTYEELAQATYVSNFGSHEE